MHVGIKILATHMAPHSHNGYCAQQEQPSLCIDYQIKFSCEETKESGTLQVVFDQQVYVY